MGGVYDTKAIARYHDNEERSYLEYIYKKALLNNQEYTRLLLVLPSYSDLTDRAVDLITLPRVPLIPHSELATIRICQHFAVSGIFSVLV